MMFITHMSLGLFVGLLLTNQFLLPVNKYVFLAIIVFASLLPDIDSAYSLLGSKTKVVAMAFRHRGVIHSLFVMIIFSIILLVITPNLYYLSAFVIGYFSHLLLDSITPKGIPLFWPSKKRLNGSLRTTGFFDWLLLLIFLALDITLLI